jgi:hypothetical protein
MALFTFRIAGRGQVALSSLETHNHYLGFILIREPALEKAPASAWLFLIYKRYFALGLTPQGYIDMTRFELKECCLQFSLLGASTESHKACFFHFSGGFLISNQHLKINLYSVCQSYLSTAEDPWPYQT